MPALGMAAMPGTSLVRSSGRATLYASILSPLTAVTEIGTSWTFSERRLAVTTISSTWLSAAGRTGWVDWAHAGGAMRQAARTSRLLVEPSRRANGAEPDPVPTRSRWSQIALGIVSPPFCQYLAMRLLHLEEATSATSIPTTLLRTNAVTFYFLYTDSTVFKYSSVLCRRDTETHPHPLCRKATAAEF